MLKSKKSQINISDTSCDADIGFILDSSGSLRAEYGKEKKFLLEVAEVAKLSPGGSRAGVVTFSHAAEHSIKLNVSYFLIHFLVLNKGISSPEC